MKKPLAGVRVLDLTNVLAGPFACHQLAHMGADVIKVETPAGGDLARQLGAERLGLGYKELLRDNPRLIYARSPASDRTARCATCRRTTRSSRGCRA